MSAYKAKLMMINYFKLLNIQTKFSLHKFHQMVRIYYLALISNYIHIILRNIVMNRYARSVVLHIHL